MKSTNSTFITEKNKAQNKPIFLYTIYNFDGASNNLCLAEWDSDVVFDSITYTRFPIRHDFIGNNSQGQIDSIQITVGNVSRIMQAYLENYELRGCKVKIRIVFADQLADVNAFVDDVFYIDSYACDDVSVTFLLSTKFDVLDIELPNRKYMRNYCQWKFKGTECKYAGTTPTCNHTPDACKAMAGGSNIVNFGGFPSIPTQRIYIA